MLWIKEKEKGVGWHGWRKRMEGGGEKACAGKEKDEAEVVVYLRKGIGGVPYTAKVRCIGA
jgi:hypothetical protein